jgi:hypothetical protein
LLAVPAAVAVRDAQLWFLPAYPPDLSPIEEAFSKPRTLLRRAEARTRTALAAALTGLVARITPRMPAPDSRVVAGSPSSTFTKTAVSESGRPKPVTRVFGHATVVATKRGGIARGIGVERLEILAHATLDTTDPARSRNAPGVSART